MKAFGRKMTAVVTSAVAGGVLVATGCTPPPLPGVPAPTAEGTGAWLPRESWAMKQGGMLSAKNRTVDVITENKDARLATVRVTAEQTHGGVKVTDLSIQDGVGKELATARRVQAGAQVSVDVFQGPKEIGSFAIQPEGFGKTVTLFGANDERLATSAVYGRENFKRPDPRGLHHQDHDLELRLSDGGEFEVKVSPPWLGATEIREVNSTTQAVPSTVLLALTQEVVTDLAANPLT